MSITNKWIVLFLFIGIIIFSLSSGPSHLINNLTGWEIREQLVFLTGTLAMSFMLLTTLVCARLSWINKVMGGLDKAYLVHKQAGIYCFLFSILHWLIEKTPSWLTALNLMTHPGDLSNGKQFTDLEIVLIRSGTLIAEILFYFFVILVLVALINKISYSIFRITHKVFPIIFLLFAYHAATAQIKENWLSSPGGYLLLLLIALGSITATISLFQQIGQFRKITGKINSIVYHDEGLIDLTIQIEKSMSYRAGQYAFLRFTHDKEPHPFTIASYNEDPHLLRFAIKELGDFTSDLKNHIKIGQNITVEGPYGEFKFEDSCKRQIWIAGGIGVTPFIARLEYLLKHDGPKKPIDFWYCTEGNLNVQFPSNLDDLCKKCNVNLHHLDSSQGIFLSENILREVLQHFEDVSVWFCGPEKFLSYLQKILMKQKFDSKNLHFDSFNMR